MTSQGLFVGLTTLDLIYQVERVPASNQKLVALDYVMAAGGPATNAAIAFQHLQGTASSCTMLLSGIGAHPLGMLLRQELQQLGVTVADLYPQSSEPPPTSSILVTQATGDRAVISMNAVRTQALVEQIPVDICTALQSRRITVVLVDGHQMAVGGAIAQLAQMHQIPVVVDGGSWKPGFDVVFKAADYVICSANCYPPGCSTSEEVLAQCIAWGIPHIAISRGAQSLLYWTQGESGEIAVSPIQAVDTLGAGDILHGAFCHLIQTLPFVEALRTAGAIATQACQHFGTRAWMQAILPLDRY
jgi:sugar/nucleoside kinase (ribokinase family)